jgi:hypothetical protein
MEERDQGVVPREPARAVAAHRHPHRVAGRAQAPRSGSWGWGGSGDGRGCSGSGRLGRLGVPGHRVRGRRHQHGWGGGRANKKNDSNGVAGNG